jgi:hypothetical protein
MAGETGVEMFTLEIETCNAAFEDNAPRAIAEILRLAADVLSKRVAADTPAYITMRDINGNTCGAFYYRPILSGDVCAVDGCGNAADTETRVNGLLYNVCGKCRERYGCLVTFDKGKSC